MINSIVLNLLYAIICNKNENHVCHIFIPLHHINSNKLKTENLREREKKKQVREKWDRHS